jgi:Domain of unknown function (DUF4430)
MHGSLSRILSRRAIVVAAALLLAIAGSSAGPLAVSTAESADNTVRLTVDYGDGVTKTIDSLTWAKGNTVLDAMKEATARPHGISFSFTGSGDATMLTKIDNVTNEGGGAGKKNWRYWVNGAYGDRSFATFELQAQDAIVWRFTSEQGQ